MHKIKVIEFESVGSTNAEAKKYAAESVECSPVLFVARHQSAGRGRLGRSFLSRRGQGIYMSLLYFTDKRLGDAVSVTTAAAVFAAKAIERVVRKEMKIKWVNDIYNENGKVAGILTETAVSSEKNAIIVGIGINIGDDEFPDELKGIASSIGEIDEAQRQAIIDDIVEALLAHADDPTDTGYMTEYRKRFMLNGAHVELFCAGECVGEGKVLGVSDDGGLIFIRDGNEDHEIIRTGEVSVRKKR